MEKKNPKTNVVLSFKDNLTGWTPGLHDYKLLIQT
jgi:hypothetical protein